MNYGEAKAHLLKRQDDKTDEETDEFHIKRELAMNIIVISLAENAERAASALVRIADALEKNNGW